MLMGGKVCGWLALHLFGFVFLQVMGDSIVIVMFGGFDDARHCLMFFLFLMLKVCYIVVCTMCIMELRCVLYKFGILDAMAKKNIIKHN